ncbi:vWA domain-containing protein [Streptosporangium saharense]|uniref:hypothetical protein n=1 Tax=Streptosporangium saharense TaxID=1706840 RepID=UPI0036CCC814
MSAPNYKTLFLIDRSASGDGVKGVEAVASSLGKVVGNSGTHDALALRSFGGKCGSEDNTTRLVGFGTGNHGELTASVGTIRPEGEPTLLRGIVEAVDDFSPGLLTHRAKQVNRIIVVTRHGMDACDGDVEYVRNEVRERTVAAGLKIEFRLVGYRMPDDRHGALKKLALGIGAPDPAFATTPAELSTTLDWFTNTEPVLRDAQEIVDLLNPTVDKLKAAAQAVTEGRLDAAERTLAETGSTVADTRYEDLRGRAATPVARDLIAIADRLRRQQRRAVEATEALLAAARAGEPLSGGLENLGTVAKVYNDEIAVMNKALGALRATNPAGG